MFSFKDDRRLKLYLWPTVTLVDLKISPLFCFPLFPLATLLALAIAWLDCSNF